MWRFMLVVLLTVSAMQAQSKTYSTAEKMAALSDLGWFDTGDEAVKRYEYILPKLVDACSDLPTDSRVADVLYVGHKYVKDAGASGKENLLRYTENAYQIVRALQRPYQQAKLSMKCMEVFALYTTARQEGQTPEKAFKTVSDGIEALLFPATSPAETCQDIIEDLRDIHFEYVKADREAKSLGLRSILSKNERGVPRIVQQALDYQKKMSKPYTSAALKKDAQRAVARSRKIYADSLMKMSSAKRDREQARARYLAVYPSLKNNGCKHGLFLDGKDPIADQRTLSPD